MAEDVGVIIQVPAGSAVDRQLGEDPPPGVAAGRAVVERVPADAEGRIVPPAGGEVVLSVLSPEALREDGLVRREVRRAARGAPPVVVVQVAEELREDELAVLVEAAGRARRTVILCILSGTV